MVDSEAISPYWTDATLKLLLNLHKRVKSGPELSGSKDTALLADAESKELKSLQKELKARGEAMERSAYSALVSQGAGKARSSVSCLMQQCLDKMERVLVENMQADTRVAVSELAVAYAELVLAIGADYIDEAAHIKAKGIENVEESVKHIYDGRWETKYASQGSGCSIEDLLDAWAGELLVSLWRDSTNDVSQSEWSAVSDAVRNELETLGISVSRPSLSSAEYEMAWRLRLDEAVQGGELRESFEH